MKNKKIIIAVIIALFSGIIYAEDSTLSPDEFFSIAINESIDLEQQRKDISINQHTLSKVKAERFPSVDFQTLYTYITNVPDPVTIDTSEILDYFPGSSSPTAESITVFDSVEHNYWNFSLKLTQPVFTWGKLTSKRKIYEELVELSLLSYEGKVTELQATINISYYSLFLLKEIEQAVKEQHEASIKLYHIASENYNKGFISYSELIEAELAPLEVERALNQITYQIDQIVITLSNIINKPELTIGNLDFSTLDIDLELYAIPNRNSAASNAMINNTALQSLSIGSIIKEHELNIAKNTSPIKPDLALQLRMGYGGPRLPFVETDWFTQDDYSLNTTIALKTTVFDSGVNKAERNIKESELESAKLDHLAGIQAINKKIDEVLSELAYSKAKSKTLSKKAELSIKQKELANTRYIEGQVLETDYLLSIIETNKDIAEYYSELMNFFIQYFTLQAVIG